MGVVDRVHRPSLAHPPSPRRATGGKGALPYDGVVLGVVLRRGADIETGPNHITAVPRIASRSHVVIGEGRGRDHVRTGPSPPQPAGRWSDADDADLAVRAATDREAFGLLYDRWFDRIYGYCYRRLQTHAAAEDATSQTFLKALAGIASYRPDAVPFRAWLFTVAHNVVVDVYRRGCPTSALDDSPDLPARETGPEEQSLSLETQREVHAMIDRLTDDQADVIRLRLAGLTEREIAAVLGRSYSAVRSTQYRAIQRIKQLLATASRSTTGTAR